MNSWRGRHSVIRIKFITVNIVSPKILQINKHPNHSFNQINSNSLYKVYIKSIIKQNQHQRVIRLLNHNRNLNYSFKQLILQPSPVKSTQSFLSTNQLIDQMPTIQLKPQHQHNKKRSQSVALQQKASHLETHIIHHNLNAFGQVLSSNIKANEFKQQQQADNKTIIQQTSLMIGNSNINQINRNQNLAKEKQQPKTERQGNKKDQNKLRTQKQPNQNKKDEKTLKKEQKSLTVQIVKKQPQISKSLEDSIISQIQAKQDKKGKKKKKKLLPQPQQVSPQQRLNIQTNQLFLQCLQRHKIAFNRDNPQLMSLLKQSYKPFAARELEQQKQLTSHGDDPLTVMNVAKEYNMALFDELNKRKHFHEDRIYLGVLEENQLFNDLIWREEVYSQPKKDQVALLFGELHLLVMNDVWEGEYEIRPKEKASKDQIIYGSYKANQIRMAESIIKEKLTNLNDQFTIDVQGQEPIQFLAHKKFDLNSEDTKKAEQFIKKLQQEQKLIKQRARKAKQQQQQEQIKRLEEQRQQQRRQQEQKIQQRRIKLLQKAQQRERLKKYRQQQQKQYQQYLSQHRQKTPLFKKKEQDFKAFLIKEQIRKFQQLREVQKHKRSVSKQELELHQIKYKQLKELLEQERQQLLKLQQEQADDRYLSFYKGKFHDSIMSELQRKTAQQQKKHQASQLYNKKLEYATVVKSKFVPKIDPKKKQELQLLINDLKPKVHDDKLLAQKTKIEGHRNLEKLHQLMAEMKAKGKIKKTQTPDLNTSQPKSSRYINYLNDIKSSRMKNSSLQKTRFSSLDTSKLNGSSVGQIEIQARNLQQHADRRSLFLKNTKNLDMEDYLERKFAVEDDYIESAKAKLHVLRKYEMGD